MQGQTVYANELATAQLNLEPSYHVGAAPLVLRLGIPDMAGRSAAYRSAVTRRPLTGWTWHTEEAYAGALLQPGVAMAHKNYRLADY